MPQENEGSVFTAGYVPLDIVSYSGRVWHAAGGTAGNVAAILGFMGWTSAVVADVGDDLAGREIRKDLKKANVSVDFVRLVPASLTPRLVHEIDSVGHRFRYRCPRCRSTLPLSRPLRKDRAIELAAFNLSADVFFFDRLNAGTLVLAEHFAASGSLIMFEPSRPARRELTERALHIADVVKYSMDRDSGLYEYEPGHRQVWIVTGGPKGAKYRVGKGAWHRSPAFSYPVVDTGGAGDWTTAGLIHSLPLGQRLTVRNVGDSLRWAQALAAVSCGAPGARGLARQQSADSVIRAAKFLEQRGEQAAASNPSIVRRVSSPSSASCDICLLEAPLLDRESAETA